MEKIMTPYVKINLTKARENIVEMQNKLKKVNIKHRPHIKTHKSVQLAKIEIESGAIGVSCATLTELEVMVEGGIGNILLAFPIIGDLKLKKLYEILHGKSIEFTTIVDSIEGIKGLNKIGERLNSKVKVLLDIDSGGHRGGVQSDSVLEYVNIIQNHKWLDFEGLFIYYGHIYSYPNELHREKAKEEADILLKHKSELEDQGINVSTLSVGSTLSSNNAEQLKGVTESRAGNFIFYDMNAVHKGIVEVEQCALRVIATVVSTPIPGKATIDAGSKSISTDLSVGDNNYGYIVNNPQLNLVKLNEEHGFIEYDINETKLNIGDQIEIIPNHSCVIPNLHHQVFLIEGESISPLEIDARYRNYM